LGYGYSSDLKNNVDTKFTRYSVFSISDKLFGIEISYIKEVLKIPKITVLPNVDSHVLGVFNLRGTIIPLIDLRNVLGLTMSKRSDSDMVVLMEGYKMLMGIIVEKVMDFANVEDIKIQISSRSVNPRIAVQIKGLYEKEGTGTIFLFDPEKLFKANELITAL
jgi:chemotaxis signal transduction protein